MLKDLRVWGSQGFRVFRFLRIPGFTLAPLKVDLPKVGPPGTPKTRSPGIRSFLVLKSRSPLKVGQAGDFFAHSWSLKVGLLKSRSGHGPLGSIFKEARVFLRDS